MRRSVIPLLSLLAWAAEPQVEVRNSEVWLIRDGQSTQLTHDGKSKLQAVLSPSKDRIAYYEQCPEVEHCTPSVVILDLEGDRVASFQPKLEVVPPASSCSSILSIAWVGDNTLAAECHINPSVNEYVETDLSTGQTSRDLLGFDFTLSPNGKLVAHVGWLVHFAPPYAKSYYLQIDRTTIYPLPKGMKPVEQKGLTRAPDVIRTKGLTYFGIHEFLPGLFWSPDSERIALVDCRYDWTENHPGAVAWGDGKESNRRCSVAIVSRSGNVTLVPLISVSLDDVRQVRLSWINEHRLSVQAPNLTETINVQ